MRKLVLTCLAGAALLSACASAGTQPGAGGEAPQTPSAQRSGASRRSNVITAEEISEARVVSALQAVQTLRPQWLRSRGSTNSGDVTIVVYRNETNAGSISALRNIPANTIMDIRFYGASEATQRWGIGHENGAIQVNTR